MAGLTCGRGLQGGRGRGWQREGNVGSGRVKGGVGKRCRREGVKGKGKGTKMY